MKNLSLDIVPIVVFVLFMIISIFSGSKVTKTEKAGQNS